MKFPYASLLHRNARAGDLLEVFFVAAIASLLLTRFYLEITGYPQVGGRTLHIAHMLPGGLLMLTGLIMQMALLGHRAHRMAAIISGIGFGLFIDELGKFITRDNNYFYQPTVALLYVLFAVLFVGFRRLSTRHESLTPTEHLLNALALSEEVVLHHLDTAERRQVIKHLKQADPSHPLAPKLLEVFSQLDATVSSEPPWLKRLRTWGERQYIRFIARPWSDRVIDAVFITKTIWMLAIIIGAMLGVIAIDNPDTPGYVLLLQLISTSVAALFTLAGIWRIRTSRIAAYNLFIKAVLIDIFLTQFFDFYREGFDALPMLIVNVLLYIGLRLFITEENKTQPVIT